MGDVIRKKLLCYDVASLLLALLLFVFLFSAAYYNISYQGDERDIRVKMNQLLVCLQEEQNEAMKISSEIREADFPYCVFDDGGRVIAATMKGFTVGEKFDLSIIGTNRYYMAPIVRGKEMAGLLLVDSSSERQKTLEELLGVEIGISLLLLVAICLVRYRAYRVMKKDIWSPINEIHKSTRSILNGNFEESIRYDYSGEIGTLCHDFEKMRDEIRDGAIREQQSREKERVLYASISHDLKTPLAIITGYLEQILYGVVNTREQILETAEHALTKVKVLNKLTEDILEHSKAQMNQLQMQKREFYADAFFKELLEEYRQEALSQEYQLTYELPPKVLILIDPDRIAQVVQNIVSNAVKYRKDRCEIQVSFEVMEQEKRILVISISDNGTGIEAADIPFVFDLFYRGNKARTQNVPGSGIGLNISKYIVEQHGGTMECDSVVGVGTTISFSIPIL